MVRESDEQVDRMDLWLRLGRQLVKMLAIDAIVRREGRQQIVISAQCNSNDQSTPCSVFLKIPSQNQLGELAGSQAPPTLGQESAHTGLNRDSEGIWASAKILEILFFWLCLVPMLGEQTILADDHEIRLNRLDQEIESFRARLEVLDCTWRDRRQSKWPNGAQFAACLTHDIDVVHWGRLSNASRRIRRAFGADLNSHDRCKAILQAGEEFYQAVTHVARHRRELDFFHWMEVENNYNVNATYFFAACDGAALNDPVYRLRDSVQFQGRRRMLADVLRELAEEGAEIGLHGSIYSHARPAILAEEKGRLNGMVPGIRGVRQHYLMASYPETFAAHRAAGFLYDSSLGFNRRRGFRCGTSFPWLLETCTPNGGSSSSLIWELPLTVQDVTLPPLQTYGEEALRIVEAMMNHVARSGGVFTLLWHNYAYRSNDFDRRKAVYREVIEELQRRKAWVATGNEIITHWMEGMS